ncbi:MAG: radical SAM protein [Proteobacteria bacterium]|nr:radical SAM protein [Pseudomonadota bacterium]
MRALLVHVPNLLWIGPNNHLTDRMEIGLMAMGLFSIADVADRAGVPVEIVNLHTSFTASPDFNLVNHVIETGAEVVGFSVHWAKTIESALRFAALLAKHSPRTKVVLGGFTASYFARQVLEHHPAVHAVIQGDGEIPFREYASAVLDHRSDLGHVPNLLWRRDGEIVENPRTYTARPQDLDDLDFARFDLLKDAHAYAPGYWTTRPEIACQKTFLVSTGRGCSFNCSFCGGAAPAQKVINNRTRFVYRSPESVMRTIETAVERGFTNIYFDYDPEPEGAYYLDLFARVRNRGLKGLTCCFGSWKLPTEALIDAMRETFDIGLFQMSPETWSEDARLRNKDARIHYSNAELEANIDAIARRGLYSQVYFGYVMPYDTREAVYGTIAYVDALNRRFGHSCEVRNLRFSTDPGSPAFQRPEKHDITLWAPDLESYLNIMGASNQRGYLNNLQLFKVNSMSDLENYLCSQMPPCYYHLQASYPQTMAGLLERLGYPTLLTMLERVFLLPRWRGVLEPLVHTFDAHPAEMHASMRLVVTAAMSPGLNDVLEDEHARLIAGGSLSEAPEKAPEALTPVPVDFTKL